jgi:GWxTD domain-containing protein
MKTLFKAALIIVLALSVVNIFADEFRFDYDYCLFRNDDRKLFLELYYSFSQQSLKFVKTDNGYEAAGELDLTVYNKNNNMVTIQKQFRVPVSVSDTLNYNKASNLTGQVNLLLDSGSYSFKIKACDFNNQSDSVSYEDNLDLNRFPASNVAISCIQIASNIQKSADKNSVFYKNTLEIIPNPDRLFGNNITNLYYYFELYNLKEPYITNDYFIVSEITDLNGNKIKSQEKKFLLKNESKVEIGSFDISDLPTNQYNLVIRVIDDKNKEAAMNLKKFFVYNSDTSKINYDKYKESYLLSEYTKYTEEQLDNEFRHATYIVTDAEREQYKALKDIEAKRKYMYEFWKKRDQSPITPINEFKLAYFDRFKYANQHFKYDFNEGWQTDRGRIYIVYGKPDDVERYPFEADRRAYEIWKYDNVEGGVDFVFVDTGNATGDYSLVHSTARNELRDDNWQRKLKIR